MFKEPFFFFFLLSIVIKNKKKCTEDDTVHYKFGHWIKENYKRLTSIVLNIEKIKDIIKVVQLN